MDFKDSKTQKIGLAMLAFFIVVYFWYSRLYTYNDNLITQKSQEFERLTTDLRNVELKAKSLDALKIEYADLLDHYNEIEALLPEVKQIPSFLVQLHTAASLTGTKITMIEPLPLETEDFYNVAAFKLEMTGTFHDFGSFVSYVANFPFIANVSDMEVVAQKIAIAEDDEEESTILKKPETVTARFTIATYFVKDSERLKELDI